MKKDLPTAVRFSARIRERAIKAEELAKTQAREIIPNPPAPPTRKRRQKTNKDAKDTREFEVATEGPGQKDTVDQGMLGSGMTVRDMQNTSGIPIIPQFASLYLHCKGLYEQQEGPSAPNPEQYEQDGLYYLGWKSPSLEPDQPPKQYEQYEDPDGFFWLM